VPNIKSSQALKETIMKRKRRHNAPRGFTLIEALFSVVIVGLGVVALMLLFAAGTEVNSFGNRLSSGVIFAEQVRAATDDTPFIDLPDLDGQTFDGSAGLTEYQIQLDATPVNPDDLTPYVGPDPEMIRMTARVRYKNDDLTTLNWLRSQ